ncbi:MAG: adenosylcobinamide-GDP ribazoletransferase [Thermostichales cyanobacterium SZTDM-1c_bins_54]
MIRHWIRVLQIAIALLTVLPTGLRDPIRTTDVAQAVRFFPLVGLGLGGILWGIQTLLHPWLSRELLAWILVSALLGLTGMLHFDGFLDCCDALWTRDPQRRLEILKDSRVGSFAVGGAWILLMGKWLALTHLPPSLLPPALLSGSLVGRWGLVLAVAWFPYGREEGLGVAYKAGCNRWLVTWVSLGVVGVLVGIGGWLGLAMGLAAAGVTGVVGSWISKRLPQGLTGDCYGLLVEVLEVLSWLGFSLTGGSPSD